MDATWVDAWASAIEHSAFAGALRRSPSLYPAVNLGHLAGLVLLVGSIGLLDLRALGAGRAVPLGALSRWLTPVGVVGLLVEMATGALLFVRMYGHPNEATPLAKLMALASLTIWIVVGGLGRILGYA